ncbi:MAG: glycoside hydrolase family 38 C-terminal domain-containing protein [Candidatus Thorarchaeota archaeon]
MTDNKTDAILISETHWDRAWYQTFQQFRLRLVKLVDNLLNIIETDPRFTHFTFDGQTIVLEDYLEVKPEDRERLTKHIQDGRILIGPWYVLPDVYLVSGEALIRNLLMGKTIADEFGPIMNVGYIPDPFGHVSQIPQILTQFRCDSVIFARGGGDEIDDLGSEFIWEAGGGSEVLAHWLPLSYGNAAKLPPDVDDAVSVLEDVVHKLQPWSKVGTVLLMNGSDHDEPQVHVPEIIEKYNSKNVDKITMGTLPQFIDKIREKRSDLKHHRGEFRGSKFQNLLSGVYSTRVYLKQLNEYTQRLLERCVEPLSAIATLHDIEYPRYQLRLAWKYLLRNHPHDDICGCSIDAVHDDMVHRFRWVHEIAEPLLDRALDGIAQVVKSERPGVIVTNPSPYRRSDIALVEFPLSDIQYSRLAEIELAVPGLKPSNLLEAAKNEVHIDFVRNQGFDPQPTATREITTSHGKLTEFEFDFSALAMLFPELKDHLEHTSTAYRIRVNSENKIVEVWVRKHYADDVMSGFHTLTNEQGQIIPVQLLDATSRRDPLSRLAPDRETFLSLAFKADDVGGLGFTRYDLNISEDEPDQSMNDGVKCTETSIENSLVKVDMAQNGTITVTDKKSGQEFRGLLEFEDSEDIGDSYDYCPAVNHQSIRYSDISVSIEKGRSGPLVGSLIASGELEIPQGAKKDALQRTDETVTCQLTTEVSLVAESSTVHVNIEFDNFAEDHRLRVLFPTGTQSTTCIADSAFDVIERPNRPVGGTDWFQPAAPTYPMRSFVSTSSKKRGLSIATKGLPEFEILEESGGTLAVTLLRSVGWLSKTNLTTRKGAAGPYLETPGAQCIGKQMFEFSIIPHTGNWKKAGVHRQVDEYLNPLNARFIAPSGVGKNVYYGECVNIEHEDIMLSAFKKSEDGKYLVLRFWNIAANETDCTVNLGFDVTEAIGARADETPSHRYQHQLIDDHILKIRVGPNEIRTVLLNLDEVEE